MSARCNVANQGCEGQCDTECFKCGSDVCKKCSKVMPYSYRGKMPDKRICYTCQDELKDDEKRDAERTEARKKQMAGVAAFLKANPDAEEELAMLRQKDKELDRERRLIERRTRLHESTIGVIKARRLALEEGLGLRPVDAWRVGPVPTKEEARTAAGRLQGVVGLPDALVEARAGAPIDDSLPWEVLKVLRDPEIRLEAEGPAIETVIAWLRKKPKGDITVKRSSLLAMILGARGLGEKDVGEDDH
jgi:hypothetical protein